MGNIIHAAARDITDRKEVEDALRRSEMVLSRCRDIIMQVRRVDGRNLDANAAAIDAYGYSRKELLSLSIRDIRLDGSSNLTASRWSRLTGRAYSLRPCTPQGRRHLSAEISSKGGTTRRERVVISVIRDITERKESEKRLMSTNMELEAAMPRPVSWRSRPTTPTAPRASSGQHGHEIRTPMNGVIGIDRASSGHGTLSGTAPVRGDSCAAAGESLLTLSTTSWIFPR